MRIAFAIILLLLNPLLFAQSSYEILVSSRGTNSVKVWNEDGVFLGDLISPGAGGLALTEDILFHPDGYLLVAGFGNQSIKKYHAISGAYLGDFSSGYTLQQPSKMSIGPDSLIYVTQWGGSQKLVRFKLDGSFHDEFTQTAVNNGLGHFWKDSLFFIAAFADGQNGFIEHFDDKGNSLGAYLGSAKMDGPTSMWMDDSNYLYVTDWTKGQVLQFDSVKGFHGAYIENNLQQPEGFAQLFNGNWIIGDWALDKVQMFDQNGNYISEIATGHGLQDPNAVKIRASLGLGISTTKPKDFKAYQENLKLIIEAEVDFKFMLMNGLGQLQLYGSSAQATDIGSLKSGVYFIVPLEFENALALPIHLQAPR